MMGDDGQPTQGLLFWSRRHHPWHRQSSRVESSRRRRRGCQQTSNDSSSVSAALCHGCRACGDLARSLSLSPSLSHTHTYYTHFQLPSPARTHLLTHPRTARAWHGTAGQACAGKLWARRDASVLGGCGAEASGSANESIFRSLVWRGSCEGRQ